MDISFDGVVISVDYNRSTDTVRVTIEDSLTPFDKEKKEYWDDVTRNIVTASVSADIVPKLHVGMRVHVTLNLSEHDV